MWEHNHMSFGLARTHCTVFSWLYVSFMKKDTCSNRKYDGMKLPLQNFYEFKLAEWACANSVLCVMWRQHLRSGIWNPKTEFTLLKTHSLSNPWNIVQMLGNNPVVLHLHKAQASTEDIPNKARSRKEEGCFVHIYLGDLFLAVVQCSLILCRGPWKSLYHNHTYLRLPICRQVHMRCRCDVKLISTSLQDWVLYDELASNEDIMKGGGNRLWKRCKLKRFNIVNLAKIYVGGFINVNELSLARTHTCIRCSRRSLENRTQSSQDVDSGVFLSPVAGNRDTQTIRLC